KGGGKSVVTNAVGVAKLGAFKRGARITVAAPGYAPASFRKADQTARHERRPARRVRVTTTNATEHAAILALTAVWVSRRRRSARPPASRWRMHDFGEGPSTLRRMGPGASRAGRASDGPRTDRQPSGGR